ncbi:MAG: hypothetical protein AAB759_02360 [Patescibacteria group bacterium]
MTLLSSSVSSVAVAETHGPTMVMVRTAPSFSCPECGHELEPVVFSEAERAANGREVSCENCEAALWVPLNGAPRPMVIP